MNGMTRPLIELSAQPTCFHPFAVRSPEKVLGGLKLWGSLYNIRSSRVVRGKLTLKVQTFSIDVAGCALRVDSGAVVHVWI